MSNSERLQKYLPDRSKVCVYYFMKSHNKTLTTACVNDISHHSFVQRLFKVMGSSFCACQLISEENDDDVIDEDVSTSGMRHRSNC